MRVKEGNGRILKSCDVWRLSSGLYAEYAREVTKQALEYCRPEEKELGSEFSTNPSYQNAGTDGRNQAIKDYDKKVNELLGK